MRRDGSAALDRARAEEQPHPRQALRPRNPRLPHLPHPLLRLRRAPARAGVARGPGGQIGLEGGGRRRRLGREASERLVISDPDI